MSLKFISLRRFPPFPGGEPDSTSLSLSDRQPDRLQVVGGLPHCCNIAPKSVADARALVSFLLSWIASNPAREAAERAAKLRRPDAEVAELAKLDRVDVSGCHGSDGKLYYPGQRWGVRCFLHFLAVSTAGKLQANFSESRDTELNARELARSMAEQAAQSGGPGGGYTVVVFRRRDGQVVERTHAPAVPVGADLADAGVPEFAPSKSDLAESIIGHLASTFAGGFDTVHASDVVGDDNRKLADLVDAYVDDPHAGAAPVYDPAEPGNRE
jgi:hypothetical protein